MAQLSSRLWTFGLVVASLSILTTFGLIATRIDPNATITRNTSSPGKPATPDNHPFKARWLATELERYGAKIAFVAPAHGPLPPRPDVLIGSLMRNRVGSWDLATMGTPASPEMLKINPSLLTSSVTRFSLRNAVADDPIYYTSFVTPEEQDESPWYLHYDLFAACSGAMSGTGDRTCRVTVTPELTDNDPAKSWLALTVPESHADDLFAIGRYALELAYAPADEGVPLPTTPAPDGWDGRINVPDQVPEAVGPSKPGEMPEERDHPFSSVWLGDQLVQRHAVVTKAVRTSNNKAWAPEHILTGVPYSVRRGVQVTVADGLIGFQGEPPGSSPLWYGSRSWSTRTGAVVSYRFNVYCLWQSGNRSQLANPCKANVYLEQPDLWLRVWIDTNHLGEIETIVHFAAEAAVAANSEGRPMRGVLDTKP